MITTLPEVHQQFLTQLTTRTGQGILPSFEELTQTLPQGDWESPRYTQTLASATQALSSLGPQGALRAKQLSLYTQLQAAESTLGSLSVIQANTPQPDAAITARQKSLESYRSKLQSELSQTLAQEQPQQATPTVQYDALPKAPNTPYRPFSQTELQVSPMTQALELMVSMLTLLIQLVQPPAAQPPHSG